ncbi:MAG: transposase [Gemmataceae bacterium]
MTRGNSLNRAPRAGPVPSVELGVPGVFRGEDSTFFFSAGLKAKMVLELLAGTTTPAELSRRHQVKPQLLAIWKKTFLERMPTLCGAAEPGESQQAKRVAELEQLVC